MTAGEARLIMDDYPRLATLGSAVKYLADR